MGFQAGYVYRITGAAGDIFHDFIRVGVILKAFELAADDVHGLMVKMIVYWNLTAGLGSEETQPILRISGAVIEN